MQNIDDRKVLLWGGGSQARILVAMLEESGITPAFIFDPALERPSFDTEIAFSNAVDELRGHLETLTHFIVCIGGNYGYARACTARALIDLGLNTICLVHARAFVDPTAQIGEGLLAMPGATVHKFAQIEHQAVLNTNCTIDHECVLGRGVHVMGCAAIAGRVRIGDFATIGTNATILPDIKIGDGAYIGAGAVVTKDVPDFAIMAGVPARQVGKHELVFRREETDLLLQSATVIN